MATNNEQNAISSINDLQTADSLLSNDYLYVALKKVNSTDTTYYSRKALIDDLYKYIENTVIMNSGGYPFLDLSLLHPIRSGDSQYYITLDSVIIMHFSQTLYTKIHFPIHGFTAEWLGYFALEHSNTLTKIYVRGAENFYILSFAAESPTVLYGYVCPLLSPPGGLFIDYDNGYEWVITNRNYVCETNVAFTCNPAYLDVIQYNGIIVYDFDNMFSSRLSAEKYYNGCGIKVAASTNSMHFFKAGTIITFIETAMSGNKHFYVAPLG